MADGVGHREHGESEREGYPEQANANLWKCSSQYGASASPNTNQNVPIASAASRFIIDPPPWGSFCAYYARGIEKAQDVRGRWRRVAALFFFLTGVFSYGRWILMEETE